MQPFRFSQSIFLCAHIRYFYVFSVFIFVFSTVCQNRPEWFDAFSVQLSQSVLFGTISFLSGRVLVNKVIQQKTPDILKTEYSWRKWPANGALKAWTKHLNVTSGATSRARQRFLKEMHILLISFVLPWEAETVMVTGSPRDKKCARCSSHHREA